MIRLESGQNSNKGGIIRLPLGCVSLLVPISEFLPLSVRTPLVYQGDLGLVKVAALIEEQIWRCSKPLQQLSTRLLKRTRLPTRVALSDRRAGVYFLLRDQ